MEEAAVHRLALQVAHRPGVRVGKDRLGSVIANHLLKPGGDFAKRFVPAHRLELAAALWSYTTKRVSQPIMMIRTLDVPVDLRAEKPLRNRMIGVPLDADRTTILHRSDNRARVRAIVWTRSADRSAIDQREGSGAHCLQTYSGCEGEPFVLHYGPNNIQRGTHLTDGPAHDDTQHLPPFARLGIRLWRPRHFHAGCATGGAGRSHRPGGAGAATGQPH